MARVLLDVGGHVGETLVEALNPCYGFDVIHTFEPAQACVARLRQFRDQRLKVHPFGLSSNDRTAALRGAGGLGATIYADKPVRPDLKDVAEDIALRDVAAWFRSNLSPDDEVWVKLNCEGSEADVVDRLCEEGLLHWIDHLLISLDVEKIPSQHHRAGAVLHALDEAGVEYRLRDEATVVGWLRGAPNGRPSRWRRARFAAGLHLPPRELGVRIGRRVLPRRLFAAVTNRFGQRLGRYG